MARDITIICAFRLVEEVGQVGHRHRNNSLRIDAARRWTRSDRKRAKIYSMGVTTEIADAVIRLAIEQKRLLEVVYFDKKRIVEPHDYGIHKGTIKLLAYQIGGVSSGRLPNWRWLEIEKISEIRLLDRVFRGGRETAGQKHHDWDEVFLRVKPARSR